MRHKGQLLEGTGEQPRRLGLRRGQDTNEEGSALISAYYFVLNFPSRHCCLYGCVPRPVVTGAVPGDSEPKVYPQVLSEPINAEGRGK